MLKTGKCPPVKNREVSPGGTVTNQLSLFNGATIDPRTNPSERDIEIASNRESLVKIFLAATENIPGKISTVENFIAAYNNEAFPHIFSILGKVSRSTLYGWVRDYREGGFDALVPLYKVRRPKVSRAEDRCLRELLLDHISIGQAIFITKYFLKRKGRESPSSPATLRRWAKRLMEKK
jgi:transposase